MSIRNHKRLLGYALREWPNLTLILGFTASMSAFAALQPWPMKLLVDHALGHEKLPTPLVAILRALSLQPTPPLLIVTAALLSLLVFGINCVLEMGLNWSWALAGQRMVYDLAGDLFRRLQRLSLLFHNQRTVGDSLNRLTGDTWCIYTLTNSLLVAPAQHLFTLVTVSVIAWRLDPGMTGISLSVVPILGISAFFFGRRLKQRTRQGREAQSRVLSFVQQTLTAIPLVHAFGTEARNREHFRRLSADAVALSQRGQLLGSAQGLVNGFTRTVSLAVILYIGGHHVLAGGLSIGSLLVFVTYQRLIQSAIQGLLGTYVSLKTTEANMDRVLEILESVSEVVEAEDARPVPLLPPHARGALRFEDVTFGYLPDLPVLHNISLDVAPGETLALVGATGAGKSTLVSLLPRFFDVWQGRVLVEGSDVRDLQLKSLRDQIALVLQEPFLLPLSIADNIAYGRPEASREQIEAAAKAANAHAFIQRLPQGYETVIGERGATLSGGERQRLSIARALLKEAPILILDEPTSALDAQTEALLLEALARLMAGRTTLIIAHRLSTIRGADRIVVLERGRIVEMGTHRELVAKRGVYHKLYALQASESEPQQEALI